MVNIALDLGCTLRGACGYAANTYNESNTGRAYRAFNPFGWKVTKGQAEAHQKKHGVPTAWFRAPGNKSSGDGPVCYYFGFPSFKEATERWLQLFAPKPGTVGPSHRYYLTGRAFWAEEDWFSLLIDAGYKGTKTQTIPERKAGSIREHLLYCRSAETYFVQDRLGCTVDGRMGPDTRRHIRAFQAIARPVGYVAGTLDRATLLALRDMKKERSRALTREGLPLVTTP
jgi:peptidoglycan hydrolase-like protein with peptidoglycan-binding domain